MGNKIFSDSHKLIFLRTTLIQKEESDDKIIFCNLDGDKLIMNKSQQWEKALKYINLRIGKNRSVSFMVLEVKDQYHIYKVSSETVDQGQKDSERYRGNGIHFWWRVDDGDIFCSDGNEKVSSELFEKKYRQ